MDTIDEHIKLINTKLQAFIRKFAAQKKELATLVDDVTKMKENESIYLEKITLLETQNSILKASAGNMSAEEKREFEKKIKDYIKKIDACITMLNN